MITPEANMTHAQSPVAVMFSGGRDSSLAACLLARNGSPVHLVTTASGLSLGGDDLVQHRVRELREIFPDEIVRWSTLNVAGLIRRIAFAEIERDFAEFKCNMLVLGTQLASLSAGVLYCRQHDIRTLVTGYTRYQDDFLEQTGTAVDALIEFCDSLEVTLKLPVYDYESADAVKYDLLDFGASTKSLEAVSVLADSPTSAGPDEIQRYLQAKTRIARRFVEFIMTRPAGTIDGLDMPGVASFERSD
jgi:hypothetical protein